MKKTFIISLALSILNLSSVFGTESVQCSNDIKKIDYLDHKIQCDNSDSYHYFTMGTGPILLIPNLGFGYRQHRSSHGYDLSLNVSTLILAHIVQGSLLYHYYPFLNQKAPWYIGAGVTTSLFIANEAGAAGGISPDFVIGKEILGEGNSKYFLEAHVQAPLWAGSLKKHKMTQINLPLMYIKYGVKF